MATDRSGDVTIGGAGIDGLGSIKQGTIEKSNVDLTSELMQMIQSQQAYNGNSRALQTGSEMMRSITELIS
jgi:flagellar basal-body rod protein FlgG